MSSTPTAPRNLHLFRLSPLLRTAETSILHIAAGQHCVALATSINTLVLLHSGGGSGPPITRQVQWFSGALKGIASMAMRDDTNLLVASHDASAFVLPMEFMLRRPPLPVHRPNGAADEAADASRSSSPASMSMEPPMIIPPDCAELLAVHGEATHASVSCCAFCELGRVGGVAAAIGSLDGTVHLISLRRRCHIGKIFAGAPISRLWDLPAASAAAAALPTYLSPTPATISATPPPTFSTGVGPSSIDQLTDPGSASDQLSGLLSAGMAVGSDGEASVTQPREPDPGCGCLLARTLQGKFLLTSLANAPHDAQWRPLVLPRGELTVQSSDSSRHGPLLLLHIADESRLLVYSAALLGESAGRHRPIFTFTLPAHTLPGSVHVGAHAIVGAQEHAGGMRALVISRHLAEEVSAPTPSAASASVSPTASRATRDTSSASSASSMQAAAVTLDGPNEASKRSAGGAGGTGGAGGVESGARQRAAPSAPTSAAARHAALRGLLPHGLLQALPLPKGTVMLVAPLSDAPTLGIFLFASRTTLYALRPWHPPSRICRRLLRPRAPSPPPRAASRRARDGGVDGVSPHDAASRIGLAWVVARTFALDFDALSARARADALKVSSSLSPAGASADALSAMAASAEAPPRASPHANTFSDAHSALGSAVRLATAPSARGAALLFSQLGRTAAGRSHASRAKPTILTPDAMAALAAHLTDAPVDTWHDSLMGSDWDDDVQAEEMAARHAVATVDVARLCCLLHDRLITTLNAPPGAAEDHLEATARAALASAPRLASRLLAATGFWQPLLFLLPLDTTDLAKDDRGVASMRGGAGGRRLPVGVPSLRARLTWLRETPAWDLVSLTPPAVTPPHQWARLVAAIEPDGADGHMPSDVIDGHSRLDGRVDGLESADDGKASRHAADAACESSRQCADTCLLLSLALLPPHMGTRADGGRARQVGSAALGTAAEALGAALEIFLKYWMRQPWPRARLAATLRAQMRGASLALCWLLEHRPEVIAQASLGPELLLDAIRVAASPQ